MRANTLGRLYLSELSGYVTVDPAIFQGFGEQLPSSHCNHQRPLRPTSKSCRGLNLNQRHVTFRSSSEVNTKPRLFHVAFVMGSSVEHSTSSGSSRHLHHTS